MFSWFKPKINRHFISSIDKFLQAFDHRPDATSSARQAEERKYERVHRLRDDPNVAQGQSNIWSDF